MFRQRFWLILAYLAIVSLFTGGFVQIHKQSNNNAQQLQKILAIELAQQAFRHEARLSICAEVDRTRLSIKTLLGEVSGLLSSESGLNTEERLDVIHFWDGLIRQVVILDCDKYARTAKTEPFVPQISTSPTGAGK